MLPRKADLTAQRWLKTVHHLTRYEGPRRPQLSVLRKALLLTCTLLILGCGSSTTQAIRTTSLVTPAKALKIAQVQLPKILNVGDDATIDQLAEDPDATLQKAQILTNSVLQVPDVADLKVSDVNVLVAPQLTYPAQFVATFGLSSVTLKLTSGFEVALFVQRGPGDGWKLHALFPIDAGVALPTISTDTRQQAGVLADSSKVRVRPSEMCARTAGVMTLASSGGDYLNDPNLKPFDPGTNMASWLSQLKAHTASIASGGSASSDQFSADDSIRAAYAVTGGGGVQFCLVSETLKETAAGGKIYQQGGDRANLGTLVPPGSP